MNLKSAIEQMRLWRLAALPCPQQMNVQSCILWTEKKTVKWRLPHQGSKILSIFGATMCAAVTQEERRQLEIYESSQNWWM